MQKIVSVFKRDYEGTRQIYNEVVEGAEWVLAGEGVATIKIDGTCCLVEDGTLYKRYDAKHGKKPPVNFRPAQEADPVTGHWPGWIPVGDEPESKWHREAWQCFINDTAGNVPPDGTYELVGAKIQGDPYGYKGDADPHRLIRHGVYVREDAPRDFEGLRAYLEQHEIEGIVFCHPDGRMAKVKRRDFGLAWPVKAVLV
jgi:hypothetical protein